MGRETTGELKGRPRLGFIPRAPPLGEEGRSSVDQPRKGKGIPQGTRPEAGRSW